MENDDAESLTASIATPGENGNGWFVYIIRCDDGSLYTGITTDPARRWREHSRADRQRGGRSKVAASERPASGGRGAKFFRGRKPLQFVYIESGHDRSSAGRREAAIKRLSRAAKLQLLTTLHNELHTFERALLPMLGVCTRP